MHKGFPGMAALGKSPIALAYAFACLIENMCCRAILKQNLANKVWQFSKICLIH